MNNTKAFTLTEIMVVVILIGIIAAFGIPNYQKAVDKAHERDAVIQLTALHAANRVYQAQVGTYLVGTNLDIDDINSGMGINLIANELDYLYNSDGTTFTATATYRSFTVGVTESAIVKDTNPYCVTPGTCPSLP